MMPLNNEDAKSSITNAPQFNINVDGNTRKESKKKWWRGLLYIIVVTFAVVVIGATVDLVHSRWTSRTQVENGLTCYECIKFSGTTEAEMGLPTEDKCMQSPKNFRKCLKGEICSSTLYQAGNATRFQRMCISTLTPKKGCGTEDLGNATKQTTCFCNFNLCT